MLIKNGNIFGEDGVFRKGCVVIAEGRIKDIDYHEHEEALIDKEDEVIEAEGKYVIPGLVDIHFHGCAGYDFCDGTHEAFDAIAQYQLKNGITSILPATMTLPKEELTRIFKAASSYKNETGSTIRGITMEGPFVSLRKKGAQNGAYIQKPDVEFYRKMQQLCGNLIRQVAIAPEEDEEYAFIREAGKETVVSIAHTTADYEMADKAFAYGATHVTHLFNGMEEFGHRNPGVAGAAFDHKNVFAELICDGVHVHPSMVRAAFALFGAERICMISDSMRAVGLSDGDYTLGGQPVKVTGKKAFLSDGTIAGSASNLYDCLKTAVKEMEIPLEWAIISCTKTPAKSLNLDEVCGVLKEGRQADLVILDKDLAICRVVKDGREVSLEL
uniref:N-acetylglucosamine-6-phosphate deacetylase n=1 Tax=Agathobacter sp. TaxID=2021311 RepID=UPI004056A566